MIIELRSESAQDTREIGAAIAPLLLPGDVVALSGDLGAGKTCLVQGAASALGVEEPVSSPTFVIVREHRGRVPVRHIDVYRLGSLQEALDLGYDEFLDPGWVTFIEWGDAIERLLPESRLGVELHTVPDDTDARTLRLTARGPTWASRSAALRDRTSRWAVGARA